jgi:hypothetical protein
MPSKKKKVVKKTAQTVTPVSAMQVQIGGDHYKKMKIQPVDYIDENEIPFIEGRLSSM